MVDSATASSDLAARRAGKSAAAFRTISEVASDLDVQPHVLRFWESKFPQIKPLKRGGGRRYYRPEDVDLLRRIRVLLYRDGYTIKGVQKLLRGVAARPGMPEDELDEDAIEVSVLSTEPPEPPQQVELQISTATPAPPTAPPPAPVATVTASSSMSSPVLTASLAATTDIAEEIRTVIQMLADLRDRLRAS
jgi:DNA-binding transcriptional MerR regulator